jgi:hypothetical protein
MAKRGLNNVLICYHGCVPQNQVPLTYREHPNDIQAHIVYLLELGYTFVLPEQYSQWQAGTWSPDYPIACIHLDDGLDSTSLILPWMIDHKIAFGLAIIGRRQRLRLPETDFIPWATLKSYVDSGLCELMSHTYNMHHLTVGNVAGNSQPIMQGPWWEDNGIVMYRDSGDTRYYWDYSHIDKISWGLPLFGTDPATLTTAGAVTPSSRAITTAISFVAAASMTVSLLRFWVALGVPAGAGYDVQVKIKLGATEVFNGVFAPTNYSTRTQWVEREIATITLDTPFAIVAGTTYTLTFQTLNVGPGLLRIYALPDFTGNYSLTSDCVSVKPGVSSGNAIIDYPPGSSWPARPVMILGDGSGALVSEATFNAAVQTDLNKNNQVIADYLNAVWTGHENDYNEADPMLYLGVAFGTYGDGTLVDSKFRFATNAHTAKTLAFKLVIEIGPWYPISADCYIGTSETGPWTLVANFAPNYSQRAWQEINLDTPYTFAAGTYWVRFVTKNATPYGTATLLRIYIDRVGGFPDSVVNTLEAINDYLLTHAVIPGAYYLKADGSDIWASDYMIGRAFIKTYSVALGSANPPKRMVYPFGAYAEGGIGPAQITNTSDISAGMKAVMAAVGLIDGQSTWPTANRVEGELNEPGIRKTKWAQSRLLMYGDSPLANSLNNLAAYCGALWQPVQHAGVKWQTSIEPDAGGNATIRHAYGTLNYVDFDAWYFNANAAWAWLANGFNEANPTLYVGVAFGTYTDGTKVDSKFLLQVPVAHTAEKLAFKFASTVGAWYSIAADCYVGTSPTGPWTLIASFTPANTPWDWQEISLSAPYGFEAGDYWLRFVTTNASGSQALLRFYVDHIDATVGAYYLKTEASDTWTGTSMQGLAFLRTRSLGTEGLYKGKMNDGFSYLTFSAKTGTLSAGQHITSPSGAGDIVWFSADPHNLVCKIHNVTGTFAVGETWSTATGSGVLEVLETFPDDKGFLQARGVKCLLYLTNYSFAIGDFDGALSSIVVNYPSGYITAAVNAVVDNGWDGAVVDIENVYPSDRTAATAFIVAVADALHAQRKLCHIAVPAITGTAYDNPAWTGWCDYAALVQRVDAMHVMTYLEAGDFSAPGPHAPTDFWNLVYHHLATTIPARFRKRVLVGCNAYSDVWDDTGAGSYNSFWDALAQGLLRGALISNEDGEATWSAYGFSAWMGVSDTQNRAVNEAIRRGFSGIGSWKADDGDRLTFFPQYPQIGRSKL